MAILSPIAILYDAAGNAISSVLKTAVRRLQTAASIQNADGSADVTVTGTRLDTSADVVSSVLPTGAATEATLALANTNLADIETLVTAGNVDLAALEVLATTIAGDTTSLDGKDFATQTTLAAIETLTTAGNVDLAALEVILTAIRDTAGIKKITDYDSILSNAIKRLETRAKIVGQNAGAGAEQEVSVIPDADTAAQKRILAEIDFKPGITLQVTTGNAAQEGQIAPLLTEPGTSSDMAVDGTTPVVFDFTADPTHDTKLSSLRLVMSSTSIAFDGSSFGKGGGALGVGVTVAITANGGTFIKTLATLKVNEDFRRLTSNDVAQAGTTENITAAFVFGGNTVLQAGSGDKVEVTISDDLTAGIRAISYFTATLYAVEVT